MRAIEIGKALKTVSKLQIRNTKSEIRNKFEVLKIGIKLGKKELRKRINRRIDKWIKRGLIKEVQNLHTKGLSWKKMSEIGLEYKIIDEFLKTPPFPPLEQGRKNQIQTLKKKMAEKTWQYAKRQMVWFKRDKNIIWLPPKIKTIEKEVGKFLK